MGGRYRSLAAARARVVVAIVLAPALEVPPRHDHRARVLAPHVLDVALVRGLARGLAQVPADTSREGAKPCGGRRAHGPPLGLVVSDSRVKRSLRAVPPSPAVAPASTTRSSPVGNRPAGANRCDSTNGVSDVDSGWRLAITRSQMRAASAITTMIMAANSAARIPSTVELVTT